MRAISGFLALAAMALASPAAAAENRCGILTNPTPANWWLTDRDGEWTIGVQGGYQAEGMENMPESLFGRGWVRTNGYYGHRCACLGVDTDRRSMRILSIHSARALPMKRCDADPALRKRR
jgi:hypothetical protein